MPYKLKIDSVTQVSSQIAKQVLEKTFISAQKIEGEQLITLTNSRQINSFLIRSLFHQWRKEVEQIESPYFDFKHEKVKEALKQFMNVLSNHISIDEEHLSPLLERAIADSLLISFAPAQYLDQVLERTEKPQDLKRELKYIKTNRELFKALIDQIDEFSTKASIASAFEHLDQIERDPIDAEELMNKLEAQSLLESLFVFEKPATLEPEPQSSIQPESPASAPKDKQDATLNDQFQKREQPMTLADKLQQKMKKSIESGLTLNEKFMFQNALFGGDAATMKEALRELDKATSLNEALEKANAFNKGWDMESEEVEALMGLLEKRFR